MHTVLFDLDGTLLDSRQPILRSLNIALEGMGLDPIAPESLREYVGPPLKDALRGLLDERGHDPGRVDALIHAYRTAYQPMSLERAAVYPGIIEMLEVIAGRSRVGVVTSKPLDYAEPILETLDIKGMMTVIEGPHMRDEREPKTVTMARALGRLGNGSVEGIAIVGDRRHDIEAGRAHGLRTIGVTWGFGTREELADAGAASIVDRAEEVDAASR